MSNGDDLDQNPDKSTSSQEFKFFFGDYREELNQNSALSYFFESDDIIPLSQAKAGDIISIVEILSIDCIEDLKNMGFIPGKEIQVINRNNTGYVIVLLDNQPIGLSQDMAKNIKVRKINLPMS